MHKEKPSKVQKGFGEDGQGGQEESVEGLHHGVVEEEEELEEVVLVEDEDDEEEDASERRRTNRRPGTVGETPTPAKRTRARGSPYDSEKRPEIASLANWTALSKMAVVKPGTSLATILPRLATGAEPGERETTTCKMMWARPL